MAGRFMASTERSTEQTGHDMRTSRAFVESRIAIINGRNGFDESDVSWNTVGAWHLYHDACGYAIHQIANVHGGVHRLYGSDKLREVQAFLEGVLTVTRPTR